MILNRLSNREKYAVGLAIGFVVIYAFTQMVLLPMFAKRERLQKMVTVKTKILEDMRLLQSEYNEIRKTQELARRQIAKREKGFRLFTFLDRLAGAVGIKDHIDYMRPSISIQKESPLKVSLVEMKLKGITLKQLVAYLHGAETSKNRVTVRRVSIVKEGKKEGTVSVILQAAVFQS